MGNCSSLHNNHPGDNFGGHSVGLLLASYPARNNMVDVDVGG